jgi:hypothetical protein
VFTSLTALFRLLKRYKLGDQINEFLNNMHLFDGSARCPRMAISPEAAQPPQMVGARNSAPRVPPKRGLEWNTSKPQAAAWARCKSRPMASREPVEVDDPLCKSYELP